MKKAPQKIIGIIPARYASAHLHGKPLADISGKPLIQRVYEQVKSCKELKDVIVATDDERIVACVKNFGGKVEMTAAEHTNGTERCAEVADRNKADYYVNIPGNDPFINPVLITNLVKSLDGTFGLFTLVKRIKDFVLLNHPDSIKVVLNTRNEAIYFSRNCIPFLRGYDKNDWPKFHPFYQHIGIYAYRKDILKELAKLPLGLLERGESLEQLRWIEHGYTIRAVETDIQTVEVNPQEDLQLALKLEGKK